MNYIYDIVLNFQKDYYQFFEWNRTDKIKNISKILVYHISNQDLINLTYNDIIIDNPLLNNLKEETKRYKKIMILVSNTKQAIGLLFNKNGTLLKRSSLLFEEETEVNNFAKELPITSINYKKNKLLPINIALRAEKEKKEPMIKYIHQTNDLTTLKYLYYEYFKEECEDIAKIKSHLLKILEDDWNSKKNNLYQIITLLTQKDLLIK